MNDNEEPQLTDNAPPEARPETPDALREELTPPREPKQARSRDKRDRLLDAALDIFAEHGFDGATIDAIAAGAGVSVGVFYSYFRSKRQMLLTLTQQRVEQLHFNIDTLDPLHTTIKDVEANLARQLELGRSYAGLRRARRELALSDPELAAYELQQRRLLRARLASLITLGRENGRFRSDLDDYATATVIFGMLDQLQEWATDFPSEEDTRLAHTAAEVIFRMLAPLALSG